MANHKSAEKRARSNARRNVSNSNVLGTVRTFEKRLRTALAAGDKTGAEVALKEYMSKASKAAAKGVVHAKTAARKIGRLSQQVAKQISK